MKKNQIKAKTTVKSLAGKGPHKKTHLPPAAVGMPTEPTEDIQSVLADTVGPIYTEVRSCVAKWLHEGLTKDVTFLQQQYKAARKSELHYREANSHKKHPLGPIFEGGIEDVMALIKRMVKAVPSLLAKPDLSNRPGMRALADYALTYSGALIVALDAIEAGEEDDV